MTKDKQIAEMAKVMNECCNRYDENGNHIGNKCYECEEWSDDNHCCCSYNTKEATALYNAGYRKADEIFEEIARIGGTSYGDIRLNSWDFVELKKKYTEVNNG